MIGEIKQDNLYLLLPSKVSWLTAMLKTERDISLTEAIKAVYSSSTYQLLEQEDTKLGHLGPVDLYADMTSARNQPLQ